MRPWMALYGLHALFFGVFVVRALGGRRATKAAAGGGDAPRAEAPRAAPHPRLLVNAHGLALGVMYFGVGDALFGRFARPLFAAQPIAGAALIVLATGLVAWALLAFRSWRLAAALDAGHELATGGPFALVRHPIYTAFDLLALGTFVWVPTWIVGAGFVLVAIGGDLRARAEERLLTETFGDRYRHYLKQTRRFVPFVY